MIMNNEKKNYQEIEKEELKKLKRMIKRNHC